MTLFHSFILGMVEGLTEFLPISSTGHMILVSHFLEMPKGETLETFKIVSQVGAIGAVIFVYFKKLFEIKMIQKLIVAFIPTGVAGIIIYPYLKSLLQNPLIVAYTMTLGGICILIVENFYEKRIARGETIDNNSISYKQALLLGLYQAIAIIPGVSRSGAMIIGGLTMRISRKLLTEFTFLLAVPTMVLATMYTLYKKHSELTIDSITPLLFGTAVSFLVAMMVITYFLEYIRSHSFKIFGWYRIIIGIVLILLLA